MIIDDFYNYIIIMAFEKVYKYENKRSLSINKLKYFRSALLEEILNIYKNGQNHKYRQEVDMWHGEVSFKKIDENKALESFLEEYEEYFYLDNNIVYLKDNVSYSDISELLRQIRINENVPNRFDIVEDSEKLMSILEISTIEKVIAKYSQIEEKLETLYYKLFTNEDTKDLRNKIKSLLFIRCSFYMHINQMPEYKVAAFKRIANNYLNKNDTVSYDKYPIDLKIWNEEYADPDDFLEDINDRVYDINQYAIFGKKKNFLYLNKICEDIENYYMSEYGFPFGTIEEEFDPLKDYTNEIETDILAEEQFEENFSSNPENFAMLHDPSDEFWILYMNYLNNLNNFMKIYGENETLLFTKKRLLYVLDKPELMLYDENNFERELNKTKTIELDEEPFSFFYNEIFFIAQEVFMLPSDEYTIRKLLLVGTYYNLTKDSELKEIIEEFSDNPKYDFFYEVMINNCANKSYGNLSKDIKKLILKPTDKNPSSK